jgi:hypothetical protein|tara:strand:- start:1534 stop:1824 length:291 start_codon:yes stop_codon:yes gene_type:complete
MNFNKIFSSVMKRENSINILNLGYVIISLVSLIGLFLYSFKDSIITCYYFIKNKFKIVEGNSLKEKGEDEEGNKRGVEDKYNTTSNLLPPADHVVE